MTPWLSTFTRRWHTNPDLCHTVDPVAAHGGRMAILSIVFFGADKNLLAACVTHDLGEYITGDIPYGAPNKDHEAERTARLDIMGMDWAHCQKLKFLDLLDSYLWARHHASELVKRKEWSKQLLTIIETADSLGVSEKLREYI